VENKFTIILKSFLHINVFSWYVVCLWSMADELSISSDYHPAGDFWMYVYAGLPLAVLRNTITRQAVSSLHSKLLSWDANDKFCLNMVQECGHALNLEWALWPGCRYTVTATFHFKCWMHYSSLMQLERIGSHNELHRSACEKIITSTI